MHKNHRFVRPLTQADRALWRAVTTGAYGIAALPKPPLALAPKSITMPTLDLHGRTAESAFRAVLSFLQHEHSKNTRVVMVITGKNYPCDKAPQSIDTMRGVLHRQLPHWLDNPKLARFAQHYRLIGKGAFYIALKQSNHKRKKHYNI